MNTILNGLAVGFCTLIIIKSSLVFASSETETIKQLVEHSIAKKKAVGVSIAIIEDNKVEYLNFGLINKNKRQSTTSNNLFEIGSISKTFTSMALASMVKEGKVKLDDPVQKYLPSTVKVPARNGKVITLLSLANHTSALPRLPNNMPFGDPTDPYADYSFELMYESDTFITVPESHASLFSDGHGADLNKAKHWQLPTLAGAGAIISNLTDMAKYLKANLNQKPLNKVVSLTHQQTTELGIKGPKVGLAWFIAEHKNGTYLWHNGGTGGFRSFIGFDKENNKGIVILENTSNGMDTLGNAYLTGTLDKLKSDTFNVIEVESAKLKLLNGHFELMPGFAIHVTNQESQLFIQATGQGRIPLTAKSELEFVNLQVQAKIVFDVDDKGQAISLTLFQAGQELKGAKKEMALTN